MEGSKSISIPPSSVSIETASGLTTVISTFYYLRIIKIIYFDAPKEVYDQDFNIGLKISLIVSTLIILLYFIYPSGLINIVSKINII